MAATAKQLAALKKGRATRKRNLAAKNKGRIQVKSKAVKKATKRKAPAKRKKNPAPKAHYIVVMKWKDNSTYYLSDYSFDNDIQFSSTKGEAKLMSKSLADNYLKKSQEWASGQSSHMKRRLAGATINVKKS